MRTYGSIADRLSDNSVPEPNTGCVLWLGSVDSGGYGQMMVGGRVRGVHRLAYEAANGPIPPGALVCHKCDQPSCIRVDHLFHGAVKDNMIDMADKGRNCNQKKTHCPAGHAYSGENTIVIINASGRPSRRCRICHNAAARIRAAACYRRKKAERTLATAAA